MLRFKIYNSFNKLPTLDKIKLVDFLHKHLEEYGDARDDIEKAVDYAIKETHSFGGFVLEGYDEGEMVGAVIINRTGMSGYIPENILVYIAVNGNFRGKGYGKKLMEKTLELAEGDVKLHVEPNNPAKFLYEKVGFTAPYLEMRYKQD